MAAGSSTRIPTPRDAELARISRLRLEPLIQHGDPLVLRARNDGKDQTVELPVRAALLLLDILKDMAAGKAVTIVPMNAELTTQEAADFLNVSRPFLVQLLEEGKMPFRRVGTHRRVRFEDVARYKENTEQERRSALDELVAEAQKLGMGY